jgi:hypothetical protein
MFLLFVQFNLRYNVNVVQSDYFFFPRLRAVWVFQPSSPHGFGEENQHYCTQISKREAE